MKAKKKRGGWEIELSDKELMFLSKIIDFADPETRKEAGIELEQLKREGLGEVQEEWKKLSGHAAYESITGKFQREAPSGEQIRRVMSSFSMGDAT